MSDPISFLLIDDEETIILSLQALIKKTFPSAVIEKANDGLEGYNIIKSKRPQIVISDYGLPKMNGLDLCRRVRADISLNDIYFIAITANSDKNLKFEILESGADDFINKPFVIEELVARLRSASRYVRLQGRLEEENKLLHALANELESSISDLKSLAYSLLHARIPNSITKMQRVSSLSIWIAKQWGEFSDDDLNDLEIAASLCDCGKIILPDTLVKNPVVLDGLPTHQLMHQVPALAKDILARVKRYKEAGNILYHVYENFDGTGFPDKLQSWQIPLASRIIRAVSDFEDLIVLQNKTPKDALQIITKASKRFYDNRAVTLLEQYVALNAAKEAGVKETAVQLHELEEGMVITRDIITNSGMKLAPSGITLRERSIKTILSHNTTDPIIGDIYVKTK
jgi:response regulator RpfG family c-di-GMP phosphodiesterase